MSSFPLSSFLSYRRDLVPRGFAPLAGPYHRTSYEDVRWPTLPGPCSLSRSSSCRFLRSDRTSMMPCITVAPRLRSAAFVSSHSSVRFAPCRVQLLCARDPSFLGNPTYSSSGCSILRCCRAGWSRSRRVLRHCCLGKLRFRRGSLEFAFADDSLTRPPRVVFFRTPSLAFTARCSPEAGKPASRGYHRDRFLTVSYRMTRAHQVVSGGYPDVPSVGEPDGHPSSLRSSWPINGESSLSGAEVLARSCRSGGIAFHRSSP
jgi:hypothetical protein